MNSSDLALKLQNKTLTQDHSSNPSKEPNPLFEAYMYYNWLIPLVKDVYIHSKTVLLIAGLVGGVIGLLTMFRSQTMRTPSFVYHKTIMAADLLFCLTALSTQASRAWFTVSSLEKVGAYHNYIQAYLAGVVSRVSFSTSGYLIMYMTLAVAVDRFLALVAPLGYTRFNRHSVANKMVVCGILLSLAVNSWSTWLEQKVAVMTETYARCSIQRRRRCPILSSENDTFVYMPVPSLVASNSTRGEIIQVKNVYNAVIRISYMLLLIFFTGCSICAFLRQRARRAAMLTKHALKRQIRKERSLFFLMITVVVLACMQVIPREILRLLDYLYPKEWLQKQIVFANLSMDARLDLFHKLHIIHDIIYTLTNFCVAMERSLLFYLYLAFNPSFRHEVKQMFGTIFCKKMWRKMSYHRGGPDYQPGHTPNQLLNSTQNSSVNPKPRRRLYSKRSLLTLPKVSARRFGRFPKNASGQDASDPLLTTNLNQSSRENSCRVSFENSKLRNSDDTNNPNSERDVSVVLSNHTNGVVNQLTSKSDHFRSKNVHFKDPSVAANNSLSLTAENAVEPTEQSCLLPSSKPIAKNSWLTKTVNDHQQKIYVIHEYVYQV